MWNSMIFILLGILLLIMKLDGIYPVADWQWSNIAIPFLFAICWFEMVEPYLGLDVRRQQDRKRQFDAKVQRFQNKKPRRTRRGFPFR